MNTIKAAILADLQAGHKLTQLTCLIRFKTMAGTQRINEMRRTTHPEIQQRMIKLDSGKRVAEYWIERRGQVELSL